LAHIIAEFGSFVNCDFCPGAAGSLGPLTDAYFKVGVAIRSRKRSYQRREAIDVGNVGYLWDNWSAD